MSDATAQDNAKTTRDRILDAAERVVQAEGARRLTIDAVVRESGLSKGGVLYHFSSKGALIEGMIARMASAIETDAECAVALGECDALSRMLDVLLNKDRDRERVRMGLMAAIAEQPELVEPVRRVVDRIKAQLFEHTSDVELALILFLAADGLRYADMLGMGVVTAEERARVEARLHAIAMEISK